MPGLIDEVSESAPRRLLLVEDDPVDAETIQHMLDRSGSRSFSVRHLTTLGAAHRVLADGVRADIILLDLSLTDATTSDALRFIEHAGAVSPVIVLTGNGDEAMAMTAARHGAQDYLVKWEFNPPFLLRSIRYAMERRESQRQLRVALELAEAANGAKSSFLAMMTHEIRTPLNAVLGMAELLSTEDLASEHQKYVNALSRAGRHLLHVVDDVLDLTRIESGRFGLEQQVFDVRALVQEPVEFMQHYRGDKPIEVSCDVDADVPSRLVGDPSRLKQVLVNLLGNAIKFTEQGHVRVSLHLVSAQEGQCQLSFAVTDSGIGIAEDKKDSIFESFSQGDPSINRRFGGSGLGLTISRRLVELMGGKIWVEDSPEAGSTFRFTIRANLPQADAVESDSIPPPSSTDAMLQRPLRVLVVDDAEDSGLLIDAFLRPFGHHVDVARDGARAQELVRQAAYDVILMDVHMPGMDGYTVTRSIRRMEARTGAQPVPVLFLTANTLAETRLRAAIAGGNGLVTKPVTRKQLLHAIRAMLSMQPTPELAVVDVTHEVGEELELSEADSAQLLVRLDEEVRPLLPRYLSARRTDLGLIEAAHERHDQGVIKVLGHNMKGSGESYGLPPITQLGAALELAASAEDWSRVAQLIQQLDRLLKSLELALENRVTPAELM